MDTKSLERECLRRLREIIADLAEAGLNDEEIEILINAAQTQGPLNA